jgi:hypothetical protein
MENATTHGTTVTLCNRTIAKLAIAFATATNQKAGDTAVLVERIQKALDEVDSGVKPP